MIIVRHITNLIETPLIEAAPMKREDYCGKTIYELSPDGDVQAVIVNGEHIIRTEQDNNGNPLWYRIPVDGSVVVFITTDSGPGVFAAGAIAAAIGLSTAGLISTGAALLIGAVGVSLLANKFLTPSLASVSTKGEKPSSATYGFDSIQNSATNGASISIAYGEHIVGGQIISAFRRATNDDNQSLSMLVALCHGPIHSIGQHTESADGLTGTTAPDGMMINGIEAKNYKECTIGIRLGEFTQTVIPGFEEVIAEYGQNFRLAAGARFEWRTRCEVNAIEINIAFPQGLWQVDKSSGEMKKLNVQVTVELLDPANVSFKTETYTFERKKRSPVFVTIREDGLTAGIWKVRVWRSYPIPAWAVKSDTKMDNMDVVGIGEVQSLPLTYPGIALVGFTIRATEQISGSTPKVLSLIKGKLVATKQYELLDVDPGSDLFSIEGDFTAVFVAGSRVKVKNNSNIRSNTDYIVDSVSYDGGSDRTEIIIETGMIPAATTVSGKIALFEWSDNPAWISHDVTTDKIYGMGNVIDYADPNDASLNEWSEVSNAMIPKYTGALTTEKRYTFNGVFDTKKAGWEVLLAIGATARAVPMKIGNSIKWKLERQQDLSTIFTMGNIEEGSITTTWVNRKDHNNAFEVRFLNQLRNYETDSMPTSELNLDDVFEGVRKGEADLPGITRPTQARRQAAFLLRSEGIRRAISWRAAIDAIPCEPGDVVGVSADMNNWGQSGRIVAVDSGEITLDRIVTLKAKTLYTWIERDHKDVIYRRDFTVPADIETNTMTFDAISPDYNPVGRLYTIGPKQKECQLVLLTQIGSAGEGNWRKLEGMEYIESVYSDECDPLDDTLFTPGAGDPVPAVTNLSVVQETSTDATFSDVELQWDEEVTATSYNVYSQPRGSTNFLFSHSVLPSGTGTINTTSRVGYMLGASIKFAVQTVVGRLKNTVSTAPSVYHILERETEGVEMITFPATPLSLSISSGSNNNRTLTWTNVGGQKFEVRYEPWAAGIILKAASTGNSVNFKVNRLARTLLVRAFTQEAGWIAGYYSEYAAIATGTGNPSGFTTTGPWEFLQDLGATGDGSVSINMQRGSDWAPRAGTTILVQSDKTRPIEYLSQAYRVSTSAANTHISIHAGITALFDDGEADSWFGSMKQVAPTGHINKQYISWQLFAEYSSAHPAVTWKVKDITDMMDDDILINAQWFRFRIKGTALTVDEDDETRKARILLDYLSVKFYR